MTSRLLLATLSALLAPFAGAGEAVAGEAPGAGAVEEWCQQSVVTDLCTAPASLGTGGSPGPEHSEASLDPRRRQPAYGTHGVSVAVAPDPPLLPSSARCGHDAHRLDLPPPPRT